MTSNSIPVNCTGASRLYGTFADFGWADAKVGAGMVERQVPVTGHPSTTRRPQEVSL